MTSLTPEQLAEFHSLEESVVVSSTTTTIPEDTSQPSPTTQSLSIQRNDAASKDPSAEPTTLSSSSNLDTPEYIDPEPEGGYQTLPQEGHEDSISMLAFYDDRINSGQVTLYGWQVDTSVFICQYPATVMTPCKFALCAANGSGKDAFIIAPFAVWLIARHVKARVVITSSSGQQLTGQTENYIKALCEKINKFWASQGQSAIFKIRQRYIKCLLSGSEIRMFATDEPGKAEGYHPMEPGRMFAIIANEAKNIEEPIFGALRRCNGFTHYLMISSPGEPRGSFYKAFTNWIHKRRVTAYECPRNLSTEQIEEDKQDLGEHSSLFRSMHLALFTSVGGKVFVSEDKWEKCRKQCTMWLGKSWPKRIGIDLAAGGDECVISIWQGNRCIYQYAFREADTTISAEIIDRELKSQGIAKTSEYIRADDGGIGKGIIDNLVKVGWSVTRRHNQGTPRNKREFGNSGAENWFNLQRLVEECFLLPVMVQSGSGEIEDKKFNDQITSRHYRQTEGGSSRIFVQSKAEAKAEGHPSPDRVDAAILALEDVHVRMFLEEKDGVPLANSKPTRPPTLEEIQAHYDNTIKFLHTQEAVDVGRTTSIAELQDRLLYGPDFQHAQNSSPKQSINGSLMAALGI